MLTIKNVTKKYNDFTALEDINLEFINGVYGLLAPNGAGKTTLIKMMTTLLFPTKGEILWHGDDIIKLDEKYREHIGYLPQEFGFYKNNTPKQFLKYLAALKGITKRDAEKRIDELLDMVSLTEEKNKKMKKFSGGMIQRVGIAQAMLNDPKILILDEPTAGLDPKERVRFRNIIRNLAKDRIVILSTHIVSDIETIADRIIMIKDHKLFCCDSPAGICKTIDGKIYECRQGTEIPGEYLFLAEHQENGETWTRFISEDRISESYRKVSPNLEDVFLYVYRDRKE